MISRSITFLHLVSMSTSSLLMWSSYCSSCLAIFSCSTRTRSSISMSSACDVRRWNCASMSLRKLATPLSISFLRMSKSPGFTLFSEMTFIGANSARLPDSFCVLSSSSPAPDLPGVPAAADAAAAVLLLLAPAPEAAEAGAAPPPAASPGASSSLIGWIWSTLPSPSAALSPSCSWSLSTVACNDSSSRLRLWLFSVRLSTVRVISPCSCITFSISKVESASLRTRYSFSLARVLRDERSSLSSPRRVSEASVLARSSSCSEATVAIISECSSSSSVSLVSSSAMRSACAAEPAPLPEPVCAPAAPEASVRAPPAAASSEAPLPEAPRRSSCGGGMSSSSLRIAFSSASPSAGASSSSSSSDARGSLEAFAPSPVPAAAAAAEAAFFAMAAALASVSGEASARRMLSCCSRLSIVAFWVTIVASAFERRILSSAAVRSLLIWALFLIVFARTPNRKVEMVSASL
eukprot:comp18193_c0_seq1/m.32087 comp18193_c0_seq1/g.32087  ORF comp18193_c0_seq1/g.32087 comp18193_c0_seq1/m.32087 type:complete len:465 (+) comp18193_c0_seq1:357-1751(+)